MEERAELIFKTKAGVKLIFLDTENTCRFVSDNPKAIMSALKKDSHSSIREDRENAEGLLRAINLYGGIELMN